MKRKSILIALIVTFLISISIPDITKSQSRDHCQAGFDACMDASDGQDDAEDCVNAWLACIGYEKEKKLQKA